MAAPHRPRRIAPRLSSGKSRIPWGGRLPEHVKDGLRRIARAENKSISWVMEEVVIDYFELERPKYVTDRKPDTAAPITRAPSTPARGAIAASARAH